MDHVERFFQKGLKLNQLRALVLLGQWGQVRIVAQKMGISQPAVSRQLADLENGLGMPVVKRVGNGLVFTEMGLSLLSRAREVVFQLDQAHQELTSMSSGLRGEIALGAVPSVMLNIATPLLFSFKERAPLVNINLVEDTSDKLYSLLANGTLHLLFSRVVPPHFADGSIVGEILFDDPLVVVCSRQHPLASIQDLHPKDLSGQHWALPPTESPAFQAVNSWMHENGATFGEGSIRVAALSVYRTLILSGSMLGIMSLRSAESAGVAPHVKILDLPGARFLSSVWMFHNRTETTSALRIAMECARSAYRESIHSA